MSEPAVLYDVQDAIAKVTLNRPENRNSMTPDVFEGLNAAVDQVLADDSLRCVVVSGNGKSFCAGADFRSGVQVGSSDALPHERSFSMYKPFLRLLQIEVPVIGALNGHAIGGGFGLAMVCDLRVANAEAKYGANFVRLGLHPGMSSTYLLPRLIGVPRALELLLTGRLVTGSEAEALGLVNYAVPADEVKSRAWELASEIASAAPVAVRMCKQSIYENIDWNPVAPARVEAHKQSRTVETADAKEGMQALLEKRAPKFEGR